MLCYFQRMIQYFNAFQKVLLELSVFKLDKFSWLVADNVIKVSLKGTRVWFPLVCAHQRNKKITKYKVINYGHQNVSRKIETIHEKKKKKIIFSWDEHDCFLY